MRGGKGACCPCCLARRSRNAIVDEARGLERPSPWTFCPVTLKEIFLETVGVGELTCSGTNRGSTRAGVSCSVLPCCSSFGLRHRD